jgi:hypothetical protein
MVHIAEHSPTRRIFTECVFVGGTQGFGRGNPIDKQALAALCAHVLRPAVQHLRHDAGSAIRVPRGTPAR